MFQEQIAEQTASHLRVHFEEYLEEVEERFSGSDRLNLKIPDVSSVSLVGGVIQAPVEALPVVAVDCLNKSVIPNNESLYLYQYDGAIVGMVEGSSESVCDRRVKRYAAAGEKFIKEHQYLHENFETNTKPYGIREFLYNSSRFSGTMEVKSEDGPTVWIAGFALDVLWISSEDGERQH